MGWHFWIDRGGTFTDVVARHPEGTLSVHKVLSEHPRRREDAALRGLRVAMRLSPGEPLPADTIDEVRMGTTVATNALLERAGAPTVFVTTKGFGDALRIGYQTRPDLFLFALEIERPDVLYAKVVEVTGRFGAEGEELRPLDRDRARSDLQAAYDAGCRACAICLMHGDRHPAHERAVAALARDVGFAQVSLSHEVSPLMKLVGRGDTTVVDAYVTPVLRRYVERLADVLDAEGAGPVLRFMQSNGGLAEAIHFRGKDALLSGPAGGVVGAVEASRRAGFDRVISFDMGGTSTDVACYEGRYERTFEAELAGTRLHTPMLQIHTVAAGGGSVCRFDGGRYHVGPSSAGAEPGPAAYGRGGPLTITDCNVMVGKLRPSFFPEVFGPAGDAPLDAERVRQTFEALADGTPGARTPEAVAEAFLEIAVQKMAQAIRKITLERGRDVRSYALCAFGGAGGQHACRIAEALGIERVLIHPYAGVLSAYGMGLADLRALREKTVEQPLDGAGVAEAEALADRLATEARAEVDDAGVTDVLRRVLLRYADSDTPLAVDFGPVDAMQAQFEAAHRRRYGFIIDRKPLVIATVVVEAVRWSASPMPPPPEHRRNGPPMPLGRTRVYTGGRGHTAALYRRADLQPGDRLDGPVLIAEATGTTVVEPGWRARVTEHSDLILEPSTGGLSTVETRHGASLPSSAPEPDPVLVALFGHRFRAIAAEMGTTLQHTSHSVNIKERRDFSCALFDAAGRLVANAPHIPVHLGSMGASVRSLLRRYGDRLRPGDAYVQNNPYDGGTHLPDVTVITPVFDDEGQELLFFVAARGHHADVGGLTPGSMPPTSTRIEEEGVLIDTMRLVEAGRFLEEEFRTALVTGPYPARNPEQNVADVRAQLAANAHGVRALRRLIDAYGLRVVQRYMQHLQDYAEASVRRVIDRLTDGAFACALDTGEEIRVAVTVDRTRQAARIDFTGTASQVASNFNAPEAVTRAAVLYVFRTLVEEDLPLNEGCLKPLEIVIPEGSMLRPAYPAAVVAGNVETSQLVVDALLGALGALAGSQGTMNNFTFGNDRYQYYETLCGGTGAGPDFDGAGAVQSHMTNTRLTDPEVLEHRFPVLVEHFGLRCGSGGAGRHRGGDGVVRKIRFRQPMTAAILSSRRTRSPFGLCGGAPGAPGRNYVERADGTVENLGGTAVVEVASGDRFVIETPGGGGYGSPVGRAREREGGSR